MKREHGQSTVEYALLAFLVAIIFYLGMMGLRSGIKTVFLAHEATVCDLRPVERCINGGN